MPARNSTLTSFHLRSLGVLVVHLRLADNLEHLPTTRAVTEQLTYRILAQQFFRRWVVFSKARNSLNANSESEHICEHQPSDA